eukprot:469161-Amphidinium_carterae.1
MIEILVFGNFRSTRVFRSDAKTRRPTPVALFPEEISSGDVVHGASVSTDSGVDGLNSALESEILQMERAMGFLADLAKAVPVSLEAIRQRRRGEGVVETELEERT